MMKRVGLLVVLVFLSLVAPAFGQPGTTPAPTGPGDAPANASPVVLMTPPPVTVPAGHPAPAPPQNEPWSNVSHINGQIVRVGERSDYLYDTGKTTNIATNPIGWIFGFYGISVSHAVHPNVAIRADANWFDLDNEVGHELGVSFPIFFQRVFQGPFLEPGIIARGFHHTCDGCTGSGDEHAGPEVLFGWQWSFDSGLNVAMALGAMRNLNGGSTTSSEVEPAGSFRVGYLF